MLDGLAVVEGDDEDATGFVPGASARPRSRRMCMGVCRCSSRLWRLRSFPGVNKAVRRWSSARRAAAACGVGALLRRPPEAEVPLRTELSRSRAAVRSRGVWIDRREDDCGSALMARRLGVRVGVRMGVFVRENDWSAGEDSMVETPSLVDSHERNEAAAAE